MYQIWIFFQHEDRMPKSKQNKVIITPKLIQ